MPLVGCVFWALLVVELPVSLWWLWLPVTLILYGLLVTAILHVARARDYA
jgi:hypothetical protein